MDRIIKIIFFGIIAIMFAASYAELSDNVSQAQLDIMYNCHIVYTEAEFSKNCRNELDGFGHYVDLSASARQFSALESL